MSRKRTGAPARDRISKVTALARRPGTAGEQVAAAAALERLGELAVRSATPAAGAGTHLTAEVIRRLKPPAAGNRQVLRVQLPGEGKWPAAPGDHRCVHGLDPRRRTQ